MFRIIGENKDKGTVSIYTIDPKVGKELGMSSPSWGIRKRCKTRRC